MYATDVREGDRLAEVQGQSPGRVFMPPRTVDGAVRIRTTTGGTEYERAYVPPRMVWVEIP
jgi:hypothetical protein